MQKTVLINGQKIKYNLKRNRKSKKISLSINSSGGITVTIPVFMPIKIVDYFIKQNKVWLLDKIRQSKTRDKNNFWIKQDKNHYLKNKNKAKKEIKEKVDYFNQFYNFGFNRISVRNQKSRWGSCSNKKNLNFNYKILFLSSDLADYIVVHELCHLLEMNHSRRFWDLVAQTIPDYKERRKKIRNWKLGN